MSFVYFYKKQIDSYNKTTSAFWVSLLIPKRWQNIAFFKRIFFQLHVIWKFSPEFHPSLPLTKNKHIECNVNNDIPVKILNFPYVLLNRSVLCNCEIKMKTIFFRTHWLHVKIQNLNWLSTSWWIQLLSISLTIWLTLKFPTLLNETTHKQTLPISLQSFGFNPDLLKLQKKTLKDFVHQFQHKKEIFDFQKRHNND